MLGSLHIPGFSRIGVLAVTSECYECHESSLDCFVFFSFLHVLISRISIHQSQQINLLGIQESGQLIFFYGGDPFEN